MARFTDREGQQATFQRHLHSVNEPQVLVFYGVGGTGKTWLLKKLQEQVPDGIPWAYLNFDVSDFGKRYVDDPVAAFQSIKQQLSVPTPRFDLALAMLHHKQGHMTESGSGVPWMDVAGEILSDFVPGAGPVLKMLSKSALARLEGTPLEKLLRSHLGTDLVIELRKMTDQEIHNELLKYLSEDLTASLPPHLNRAVTCVIFLDTFEAVGAGFQNIEHKRSHEKWIQDLAAQCPFALVVIAGQNRLSWDEVDSAWASCLDQHLVGGLSEEDARHFLARCDITSASLQDCILSTSKESTGGYHCFSLGLCSDIVANERNAGREPEAESLRFNPQDWDKLARRFLKSLASDSERTWIENLALTPRFDEAAARWAYCSERSAAQTAAWKNLHGYSFVERLPGSDWSSIRAEMRTALRNQPSAQERVREDHQRWRDYWSIRSKSAVDVAASLAWYHSYSLDPSEAMNAWQKLAENARISVPARMREHYGLLQWLEPLGLFEGHQYTEIEAKVLRQWGNEQLDASLNRGTSLQKAIACYESALRIYTEQKFPQYWAGIQNNLGKAWGGLTTGDRTANLGKAIACCESALRIYTEQKFPRYWARIQNNLGGAWSGLSTGDRTANLKCAIDYYESALHIHTEHEFPQNWARVQNNLGNAWSHLPTGDLGANLKGAIACFEAALHVYTEQGFPQGWASIQSNLGAVWSHLPTGDRTANFGKAVACFEAAMRIYTEQEFPENWASVQSYLGTVWSLLPTGDRTANLGKAIACFEASMRVYTEQEYPENWAGGQNNLGITWKGLPTGDRTANLGKAIACFEAALRVHTEQEFPENWARVQNNLGNAWSHLPTGDLGANLKRAIACFEAALHVYTEQGFPQGWARVQSNLGDTWNSLPTGDKEANVAKAIACFEAALRVFTEQEFPHEWAIVQKRLDNSQAYLTMVGEDLCKGHRQPGGSEV
jgi:tetratricopeptide (TPR) repeat protein